MGDMSDQGHPYVRSVSGYTHRLCVCFQLFAADFLELCGCLTHFSHCEAKNCSAQRLQETSACTSMMWAIHVQMGVTPRNLVASIFALNECARSSTYRHYIKHDPTSVHVRAHVLICKAANMHYSTTPRNGNPVNGNHLDICLSFSQKNGNSLTWVLVALPVCPTSPLRLRDSAEPRPNLELASGNCES